MGLRRSIAVALALLSGPSAVAAQNQSDVQSKVQLLSLIRETAKDICTTVPLTYSGQSYTLNANAKAQLSGLVRAVSKAGISGGGRYSATTSQGVLASDLASSIKDANSCKLAVFNVLVDKLLSSPTAAAPPPPPARRPQPKSRPAPPPVPAEPMAYSTPTGRFVKRNGFWIEEPPYAPGSYFAFTELGRDAGYIYLVDRTRQKPGEENNPFMVRLPVRGGSADWSYQNPVQWTSFTIVQPTRR